MSIADPNRVTMTLSERAGLAAGAAIGKLMRQALQFPDLVSLAAGFVDNATLPSEAVGRCMSRIAENPAQLRKALQYDATAGSRSLREKLAEWSFRDFPDAKPDADRLILTAGSNQFLHLLSEAILDAGDIVLVAEPTYFVYLGTLKNLGAKVIGVPADEDGICIDALQEKMNELREQGLGDRIKAIYSVTEFDNPAGSTLSLQRRRELLDLVARWRKEESPLLLLSDNAYQLLRYYGESLPPLSALHEEAADFVVELGTFSKSFSPGIRVGWGVVPEYLVAPLLDIKSNIDFGSPHFSQVLVEEALQSGEMDQHLPVIQDGYRSKLEATIDALQQEFGGQEGVQWRQPKGGLYVWLELPESVDTGESGEFWQASVERGVLYVPGHHCFSRDSIAPCNTIRLSFGVQDEEGIRKGVKMLAEAYRQLTN